MTPSKKVVKKVARPSKTGRTTPSSARTPKKTIKKVGAGATVSSETASQEVFNTNPERVEQLNVPAGHVRLFINGRDEGDIFAGDQTVYNLAKEKASARGIRTFSMYGDGVKLWSDSKDKPASSYNKLEIVTKDARG